MTDDKINWPTEAGTDLGVMVQRLKKLGRQMIDEEHAYLHPGYKKPYPIETVLRDLAAQEGCDGEPYDAMVFAADAITAMRGLLGAQTAEIARLTAERDATLAGAVKVKPLVWKPVACSYPRFEARSLGLVYEASCDPEMGWAWAQGDGLVDFVEAADEEAAKAAAQADYEASARAVLQPDPDARQVDLSAAARDVLSERARQISVEGWTPDHDDMHEDGEMAEAAGCYALNAAGWKTEAIRGCWPIKWMAAWFKPTDPRRDLVKAAALCIAEIERLDRALTPPADLAAKIGGE